MPVADAGTLWYECFPNRWGYMNRYQALLGTAVADSLGKIKAYVACAPDNDNNSQTYGRCMYDGVAYQLVPEPSSLALFVAGLIGLLAYAWRKRK